jgi:hypothetical protein
MPDGKGGFRKRPFAYSTQAESDYMRLLADLGYTFASALERCEYAPTERSICQAFVDAGHGDVMMNEWVR